MFACSWCPAGRLKKTDAGHGQVAAAAAAAAVAAGSQWVGVLEVEASWRSPL